MPTVTDRSKSAVYSAEDQFAELLNRGGNVDFFGSALVVPTQRRFGELATVTQYVQAVMSEITPQFPGVSTPQVRERRGARRAHYEYDTTTIALPTVDQWALRESVILHECAHHLTWWAHGAGVAAHGGEFTGYMLYLVRTMLGPPAELLLRAGYQAAGVPISVVELGPHEN